MVATPARVRAKEVMARSQPSEVAQHLIFAASRLRTPESQDEAGVRRDCAMVEAAIIELIVRADRTPEIVDDPALSHIYETMSELNAIFKSAAGFDRDMFISTVLREMADLTPPELQARRSGHRVSRHPA